jgi:hypothetical protein
MQREKVAIAQSEIERRKKEHEEPDLESHEG